MISKDAVKLGCGADGTVAKIWLAPIQAACERFSINTPNRVAAFLANVGVESAGLTRLAENLNYGADRLAAVWPGRFAVDPKVKVKEPNAFARSIAGKPEAIANIVYANRLGNGNADSGDGFRYRGRGPIQLTGRANYEACGDAIGIDLLANPEALVGPEAGALSAAWFFYRNGCNALADAGNISKIIERINGAPPSDANQGSRRIQRYNACRLLLLG
ncbi:lysozyme [Luteibacter phage vB_LflM-Pluto]|uniref:Lysozyme n=1 Tax=Luteibacter phage vB_LflM-Pluto TaxID=2948611 RepID=A0A9E7MT58_9CAUD|nr:lysozyme [Luteibacter phage vB_LflM-Pluto]